MPIGEQLQTDFNNLANDEGTSFSVQSRTYNYNPDEYDDFYGSGTSVSGSVITGSCFFQPISGKGGADAQFIEQGLVTLTDFKAFVPSGLAFLSNADFVVNAASYYVLSQYEWRASNIVVYKEVYLRSYVQV